MCWFLYAHPTRTVSQGGRCLGFPLLHRAFYPNSAQSGLGRILTTVWSKAKDPVFLDNVFTGQLAVTLLSMARQGHGIAWLPRTLAAECRAQS
jgi:DNA-binding transcriptional LysR family regulator